MMGCRATLLAAVVAFTATSSQAFITNTPIALHSSVSSSQLMSAGTDYVATLPGAPFPDGAVWDPVGLSDGADPEDIKKWREAEIKHGRVAMLASVGVLVAEVSNSIAQYLQLPHFRGELQPEVCSAFTMSSFFIDCAAFCSLALSPYVDRRQKFHPLFLGNDYIGPAVDHFQEITAQFPQVWILCVLASLSSHGAAWCHLIQQ